MLDLSRYPFLRILPAFIAGIVIYDHIPSFNDQLWWYLLFILILFTFLNIKSGHKPFNLHRNLQGVLIFVIYIFTGYTTSVIRYNSGSNTCFSDSTKYYSATAIKLVSWKGTKERYIFEVNQMFNNNTWSMTRQRVLVNLETRKKQSPLPLYCKLLVEGHPKQVEPPLYRSYFNYKKYLARKGIHYQQFINSDAIHICKRPQQTSLRYQIYSLHEYLKNKLKTVVSEHKEYSIALAMLIGDKSEIEPDIRDAYSTVGAAHILAVSGLHTGIVFLIISLFFIPLKHTLYFKWLYYVIVLASIWFYALLTGLLPSVTRASLMLSFVLIGTLIKGKYQIINSLAASAFFILLIQPWLVFSVSFQLSYLAVFGIVLIYPKLYTIISPPEKIMGYLWKIICVSIAAQVATFPLVIYYFHQFSPFFIVTNIFVIPATAIIIFAGMLILILEGIGLSIPFINVWFEKILYYTNQIVYKIESLPGSHMDDLYLDFSNMLLIFLFVTIVIIYIYYGSKKILWIAAISSALFITGLSTQIIRNQNQNIVVVYNQSGFVHTDFIRGNKLLKYKYLNIFEKRQTIPSLSDTLNRYYIKNIQSIYKSDKIFTSNKYDLIIFKGKRFLFLKQPIINLQKTIHVNYLFFNDPNMFQPINSLKNLRFDYIVYTGIPRDNSNKSVTKQLKNDNYYDINKCGLLKFQL